MLSDAETLEIRHYALQGLAEEHIMMQTAFGMVLAAIAKQGGKDTWYYLFDALLSYLHSGKETLVRGSVKCFSLFADYFDDETLPMVASGLFPPLVYILSTPTTFNSPLRQQSVNILYSCVEVFSFSSASTTGTMANLAKQVLPNWVDMLLPGLDAKLCNSRGLEEMGVHIEIIKLFGVIIRTMCNIVGNERKSRILLSVCNYFRDLSKAYINSVVFERNEGTADGKGANIDWGETTFDQDGNEIGLETVVVHCMQFFITMMDGDRKLYKSFYKSGALPLFLETSVELLCITPEQVFQWKDNPEEYVAHEDESTVGNSISVRNTAKCLVDSVSLIFGRLNACEYLISTMLPKIIGGDTLRTRQANFEWKVTEALLVAIGVAFSCDRSSEHRVRAVVIRSNLGKILNTFMAIPHALPGFNYRSAEFLYPCAQSISCYSALLLCFSPEENEPFLTNICSGIEQ